MTMPARTSPTDVRVTSPEELAAVMRGRRILDGLAWRFGLPGRRRTITPADGWLAVGATVIVLSLVGVCLHSGAATALAAPTAWFAGLRIAALVWPVRLRYHRLAAEITLDSGLLALWLLTMPPAEVALLWVAATTVAELLRSHIISLALINTAMASLAVVAAVGTFRLVDRLSGESGELLPAVAAALTWVLVDHLQTRLVLRCLGEHSPDGTLMPAGLSMCLVVAGVLATSGWAMAQVPGPAAVGGVVLCLCTVTMMVLMSSVSAMVDERDRLRVIVGYLHRMGTVPDPETALRELEVAATTMLGSRDVRISPWPPVSTRREVGFLVQGDPDHPPAPDSTPERWLIARTRTPDPGYHPAEVAALEALALVARDGIALRRTAIRTEWLAAHDVLTGMPNRTSLLDQLLAAERLDGPAAHTQRAVILLDIDGFKEINDRIGHEAGDHVLSVLGPRIRHGVPAGATAARLGGDEFACYLPDVASVESVRAVCEGVRELVRRPIVWKDTTLTLDASIGFAVGPGTSATGLLREADEAMYLIKHSGKGGVAQYPRSNPRPD